MASAISQNNTNISATAYGSSASQTNAPSFTNVLLETFLREFDRFKSFDNQIIALIESYLNNISNSTLNENTLTISEIDEIYESISNLSNLNFELDSNIIASNFYDIYGVDGFNRGDILFNNYKNIINDSINIILNNLNDLKLSQYAKFNLNQPLFRSNTIISPNFTNGLLFHIGDNNLGMGIYIKDNKYLRFRVNSEIFDNNNENPILNIDNTSYDDNFKSKSLFYTGNGELSGISNDLSYSSFYVDIFNKSFNSNMTNGCEWGIELSRVKDIIFLRMWVDGYLVANVSKNRPSNLSSNVLIDSINDSLYAGFLKKNDNVSNVVGNILSISNELINDTNSWIFNNEMENSTCTIYKSSTDFIITQDLIDTFNENSFYNLSHDELLDEDKNSLFLNLIETNSLEDLKKTTIGIKEDIDLGTDFKDISSNNNYSILFYFNSIHFKSEENNEIRDEILHYTSFNEFNLQNPDLSFGINIFINDLSDNYDTNKFLISDSSYSTIEYPNIKNNIIYKKNPNISGLTGEYLFISNNIITDDYENLTNITIDNCNFDLSYAGIYNNIILDSSYIYFSINYLNRNFFNTKSKLTNALLDYSINQSSAIDIYGEIGTWDTSLITNMRNLFINYPNFNEDISTWNVSSVLDMGYMFYGCKLFNQDISSWNVDKVTTMEYMFYDCESFNYSINNWNTLSLKNTVSLFEDCKIYNQPLSNWNMSSVTDMNKMFDTCINFNQDISEWNISNVTNMASSFRINSSFNQNLSIWNVSNVLNMRSLFESCNKLNQSFNNWNVSNVRNMRRTFNYSINQNNDLSNWNVSNVTNLTYMFGENRSLSNQNILNILYKWNFNVSGSLNNILYVDPFSEEGFVTRSDRNTNLLYNNIPIIQYNNDSQGVDNGTILFSDPSINVTSVNLNMSISNILYYTFFTENDGVGSEDTTELISFNNSKFNNVSKSIYDWIFELENIVDYEFYKDGFNSSSYNIDGIDISLSIYKEGLEERGPNIKNYSISYIISGGNTYEPSSLDTIQKWIDIYDENNLPVLYYTNNYGELIKYGTITDLSYSN